MTKVVDFDHDYRHAFTDASHLLHNICRSHYSLSYEQWKEIFDEILEQIAFDEEESAKWRSQYIDSSFFDSLSCK